MKIIVIGSKGFIGSACYSYFKSKNDNFVYGADVVTEYNDPNYFLITSIADFKTIFKELQFDWCINCSGAASVSDSFEHPLRDYLLNVYNVVQLLNAIKDECPKCKFIQLSSAAVYGNPLISPIKEAHFLSPLSPYGIHKKQAEELCKLYSDYFGIYTYVLRIFSAYGIGLRKQIFWDLYKKSLNQKNIALFGTGKETRDFIYIADICLAIEKLIHNVSVSHLVVNIANGKEVSIEEAAITFLKLFGYKGNINFNGKVRQGDPLNWRADISILQSLGYTQGTSFVKGIENYCAWLEEK